MTEHEIFKTVGDMQIASKIKNNDLYLRFSKQGRKKTLIFNPNQHNFSLDELAEAFQELSNEAPQFLVFECLQCTKEFRTRDGDTQVCEVCGSRDIQIKYENPTFDTSLGDILLSAYFYGSQPVMEMADRSNEKTEIFQMVNQDLGNISETVQEIESLYQDYLESQEDEISEEESE
jgi:DNA-directed RNA polymerase subunit RPC12/RpoP